MRQAFIGFALLSIILGAIADGWLILMIVHVLTGL